MADGADRMGDDAQAKRRERELDAVYRANAPGLARYLRARFRGSEDVDDMVQDVFASLAGSKKFFELRNREAYLRRILRNFLIDRNRRSTTRPVFIAIEGCDCIVQPEQTQAMEVAQMQERYRAAVEQLPPRTREVFLLHRVEETPVKEIASRLAISTRTVEWHLAQAIIKIREALEHG